MRNVIKKILFIFIIFFSFSSSAKAYIGPAIAFGTLAIILLLVLSIFFALVGIFYMPLKKIYLKLKKKNERDNST